MDETLTMWPPSPRSTICRPNRRQPRYMPSTLMARMRAQSSSEVSRSEPAIAMPALLTTTSGTPRESRTWSANCSIASASVTSTLYAWASPPAAAISCTVRLAAPSSMSATTTRAPSAAKACAVARPMPLPAPVTTTRSPPKSLPGSAAARAWERDAVSGPPSMCSTNSATQRATRSG